MKRAADRKRDLWQSVAIATPYRGESHYSLYLSLFGRDMKAGETAKARSRFVVTAPVSEEQVLALYERYGTGLRASPGP